LWTPAIENLSGRRFSGIQNDGTDVAELSLHYERLTAMEVCSLQDPFETPDVKGLEAAQLCPVKCPHLATVQQGGYANSQVDRNLGLN